MTLTNYFVKQEVGRTLSFMLFAIIDPTTLFFLSEHPFSQNEVTRLLEIVYFCVSYLVGTQIQFDIKLTTLYLICHSDVQFIQHITHLGKHFSFLSSLPLGGFEDKAFLANGPVSRQLLYKSPSFDSTVCEITDDRQVSYDTDRYRQERQVRQIGLKRSV